MRLKSAYTLCKENYDIINSAQLTHINKSRLTYSLENIAGIKNAIESLSCIEYLKENVRNFSAALTELNQAFNDFGPDVELKSKFNMARDQLVLEMKTIINICESFGIYQEEGTIGIDIKFPISDNFVDFRKNIDELDFVLTKCPFLQSDIESLRFSGMDIGSAWLAFIVIGAGVATGSVLLNNIAALVDKSIIIRSHFLTTQGQKQDIEKSRLDQKAKNEIIENINKIYKIQVENAIKELEEISGHEISDGDERGRAEQSFEKLGRLIDKGLQIYSSIDAPQETKELFGPLEMKYLSIENKLKVLEKKKDDN